MDAASQTSATSPSPAATWQVWRIDDNGNTFLMRDQLTHEEADRVVAEFTARGHKQTYWAEQVPGEIDKL
jgi:hypothetical protein